MGRELYQLVALSKDGVETIVELNNENEKNKGTLQFIDSGTTRFQNEVHLKNYLYEKGKIPNKEVELYITYNHNGKKKLPLIYNDLQLATLSNPADKKIADLARSKNYEVFLGGYVHRLLKYIEVELCNHDFYTFIIFENNKEKDKKSNGNYLNKKLMDSIIEYYESFVRTDDMYSNRADVQAGIFNELFNYKQLRTMHEFYKKFKMQQKINNNDKNVGYRR